MRVIVMKLDCKGVMTKIMTLRTACYHRRHIYKY